VLPEAASHNHGMSLRQFLKPPGSPGFVIPTSQTWERGRLRFAPCTLRLMLYKALVAAALLLDGTNALLQPACCTSRLSVSRVAVQRSALCMCDAEAPAAEVAEVVAEAPAAEAAAAPAPARKGGKTPLTELVEGSEVTGKIRSVMAYGAFVDIGALRMDGRGRVLGCTCGSWVPHCSFRILRAWCHV
jgi:hypothetical protein